MHVCLQVRFGCVLDVLWMRFGCVSDALSAFFVG